MITTITKSEKSNVKHNVVLRLFDPKNNKPKPHANDPTFSEDVCIIDENGVNGLAFFAFEEKKWVFYVDTLIDYNEEGADIKWRWYYPPLSSKNIDW